VESPMKIAVTGASGFLGGHIVKSFLDKKHDLVSLMRPSSNSSNIDQLKEGHEIIRGQLDDTEFLAEAFKDVDVVIHSAARVKEEGSREQFVFENLTLTQKVVNAAKKSGVKKFIFISSPSVLAELKDQIDIDESYPYPTAALNYYCETKALAEQYVLQQNTDLFSTCSLRPRCIWGPGDESGPFKKLMSKLNSGEMRDLSGGQEVYSSMCYVGNATHACLLVAQSANVGGKAYFITDQKPVETWEYLDYIADYFALPRKKSVRSPKVLKLIVKIIDFIWSMPYLEKRYPPPVSSYAIGLITHSATFSIEAAKADFGYGPIITMEEGLKEYSEWIRDQGGVKSYLSQTH
jgi:nucleoside-diphosphate-sugar epimerase